jgi:hypothetical protein
MAYTHWAGFLQGSGHFVKGLVAHTLLGELMSTQITASKGSYSFTNDSTAEIPVDIARYAAGADTVALISTSLAPYTITNSSHTNGGDSLGGVYPLTPPDWVMTSAFLALLVTAGSVTVA